MFSERFNFLVASYGSTVTNTQRLHEGSLTAAWQGQTRSIGPPGVTSSAARRPSIDPPSPFNIKSFSVLPLNLPPSERPSAGSSDVKRRHDRQRSVIHRSYWHGGTFPRRTQRSDVLEQHSRGS